MWFIRLPKPIDIAESILPELGADWMNTKSVQNIATGFVRKVWINILISWVIEWSKSGMFHLGSCRNFTHRAWAIWDWKHHDLFLIIPDPGSQKRLKLSLECITTTPFQARTSYVKIPEWGHRYSNCRVPCFVSMFGTVRRIGDPP